MKNEFEQWMIKQCEKSPSTANSYKSAINTISHHYSKQTNKIIDLYAINDITFINGLVKDYGKGGKYQDIGEQGHATVRNAIAAYARFLEQKRLGYNADSVLNRSPKSFEKNDKKQSFNTEDKLEVINKAFRLILPVLAKYIGKILKEKDMNNWWRKYVLNKLKNEHTIRKLPKEGSGNDDNDYIESLDIPACLNIIECDWVDVFKDKMDDRQCTWAHALYDIRNYYESHYTTKTLTTSSVEDISLELAIMVRFMRSIDSDTADRIVEMKKAFESKFKDK